MTTDQTYTPKIGDRVKVKFVDSPSIFCGELKEYYADHNPPWALIGQGGGEYGGHVEKMERAG